MVSNPIMNIASNNVDNEDADANNIQRQKLRKKIKRAIKIPQNQEEFYNNLKICLMRNEKSHGLSEFKLNFAFKKLIKKDKIYNMLKDVEQKLNSVYKKEILSENESEGNSTLKKDISPKVKKVILPLYKKLLGMILDSNHITDVVKFNVIAICLLHLKKYIINDKFKKILLREFQKLLQETRKCLKI